MRYSWTLSSHSKWGAQSHKRGDEVNQFENTKTLSKCESPQDFQESATVKIFLLGNPLNCIP